MPRGRPRSANPIFVEDHTELDIAKVLSPKDRTQMPVSVTVTIPRLAGADLQQTIKVTSTEPFYGGERYWFECPLCKTRRGKVYLMWNAGKPVYACRTCSGLVYRDQYRQDPYPELRRFLNWRASGNRSKRQWSHGIERKLETGEITWEEAWAGINS